MAEETLASAAAVPQAEDLGTVRATSPDAGLKRRQSSASEESGVKRRRLSDDDSQRDGQVREVHDDTSTRSAAVTVAQKPSRPERKTVAAAEERKRGQRLFGGLLGTLSQSSSTMAQKRRADIEQRQQAKLKLLDEQHSETKRRRRDELVAERGRKQKTLERTSMEMRHQNMLQTAGFLRTKVEPVLLWRPFELRGEDEEIISKQLQKVKEMIAREESEFEQRWRDREKQDDSNGRTVEERDKSSTDQQVESIQDNNREPSQNSLDRRETDNAERKASTTTKSEQDAGRQDDEGEDVMEDDKEDMVLY